MDAKSLMLFAAIGMATPARGTFLAIDIRLDRATVTGLDVCDAVAHRDDFHAQLMSRNARVTIKRHFAEIPGVIGAANTHAMHLHQGLAWPGRIRLRNLDAAEVLRFFELNGFHLNYSPAAPPSVRCSLL